LVSSNGKRLFKSWINDVKINYELLDLYWELGKNIVSKQKNAK
jgi:hypothetical protein